MRARLAKQEALDEERISRQINAQNGGHSNDRSPPSRAIIRSAHTHTLKLVDLKNCSHLHSVVCALYH
jgi:hypothetical protein